MNMDVIEKCKYLLVSYGYTESSLKHYIDFAGCDLYILLHTDSRTNQESLYVWFGGVEVCRYCSEPATVSQVFIPGIWVSLVDSLYRCYCFDYLDTFFNDYNTLIELCRMESQKNREIIKRVFEYCISIIKNDGYKKRNDPNLILYAYEAEIDGARLTIELEHNYGKYDAICVSYDKKTVFVYYCNNLESNYHHDNKCKKLIPGQWVAELQKIAEEITD